MRGRADGAVGGPSGSTWMHWWSPVVSANAGDAVLVEDKRFARPGSPSARARVVKFGVGITQRVHDQRACSPLR